MLKTMTVAQAIGNRGPKIFVYGDAGTGKTTQIVALPGRKLVTSAEHGLLSILDLAGDEIEVVIIESLADFERIVSEFEAGTEDARRFDWLCLDSLSEIAEVLLDSIKHTKSDPRQAYGEMQDKIRDLMRRLRDLDVGVYAIGKEQTIVDDRTDPPRNLYQPSMPGQKLGPDIPYVFDQVLRLVVDGTRRTLITQTDGRSKAKDRSGKLARIEEADLGPIVEKITKKKEDT